MLNISRLSYVFYSLALLFSSYSHSSINTLYHLGESLFSDVNGNTEQFICPAGGEPLVIYSTPADNNKPISSKSKIFPIYIKKGFSASPIQIQILQQSDKMSNRYLYIKSRVPSDSFLDFDLTKKDSSGFWVDSVQYPVIDIDTTKPQEMQKYMTLQFVKLDDGPVGPEKQIPNRNYSFIADYGLYVYRNIHKLTGSFTGWNQATLWDTAWEPLYEDIPFIFTSMRSKDDPSFYNGYGLWVCGAETEQQEITTTAKEIQKVIDKK
ncbi:MAG: hypothetical protein HAW66_07600 [Shewanella sp.]|nr:hypothetical protein [Shewanella sp.]